MANLKSGAFVIIMLLNESLIGVHSQKDPRLHFGEFHFKGQTQFHPVLLGLYVADPATFHSVLETLFSSENSLFIQLCFKYFWVCFITSSI